MNAISPIRLPIYKTFSPVDTVDTVEKLSKYHWDQLRADPVEIKHIDQYVDWSGMSSHMLELTAAMRVPNGYYWMRDDGKVFYTDIDLTSDQAYNETLLQQTVGYNKHNTQFFKFLNSELGPYFDVARGLFPANTNGTLIRIIVQMPGQMIPVHIDTFVTYRTFFNVGSSETVLRRNVFVTPWDWGHFLHYGTSTLSMWRPGDYLNIAQGVPHGSANAGLTPKITMQWDSVN